MKIILDESFNWDFIKIRDYSIWYIGEVKELMQVFKSITILGNNPDLKQVDKLLKNSKAHGAAILKSNHNLIAFVDHFRCYPIFYKCKGSLAISAKATKCLSKRTPYLS